MKTNFGAFRLPAAALLLSAVACSSPDLKTSLRAEGPPEVLAVIVRDPDWWWGATYCREDDENVPDEFCNFLRNDDGGFDLYAVAQAEVPQFIVVFDELLDASIETLTQVGGEDTVDPNDDIYQGSIAGSLPFDVTCGPGNTPVAYDGYYVPNGNAFTYPPGPSLVIEPLDVIPAGETCQITLKSGVIKDKTGEAVPSDQLGPYDVPVVGLALLGFDPPPNDPDENDVIPPTEVTPDVAVYLLFNNYMDGTALNEVDGSFVDSALNEVSLTPSADGTAIVLTPDAPLMVGETYTLTLNAGSVFYDLGGGSLTVEENQVLQITVVAAEE